MNDRNIDDMMEKMNLQGDGLVENTIHSPYQESLIEADDDYFEDVFEEDPNRKNIRKSKAQAQILLERKKRKQLIHEMRHGNTKNGWMKK